MSFLIFNFSYLFSVLFLAFLVLYIRLLWIAGFIFIKYLIILIYVRGVVVFILYISCICWFLSFDMNKGFLLFIVFVLYMFDIGNFSKFSDFGEFLWIFIYFGFLFNCLAMTYSLNLFKVAGSLRF